MLYINRTEFLCILLFTKNYSLKIYVFWIIGEISDFNDVILSDQSKNNIIKFERVVYQ